MRPLIGTSLKMNLTSSEAAAYFDTLRPLVASLIACDMFVLPPFTSIWVARERLTGSNVAWGGQDVHAEDAGAHTGDISAPMLADLGCTFVEVGHSERRRAHGETDDLVARKVRQVVRHAMTPIMCVGEPGRVTTEAAVDHVVQQARAGLGTLNREERARAVIAYEPVWAIGEGAAAADPHHIAAVHAAPPELGASVIYGGRARPGAAGPIRDQPGLLCLFAGRAALGSRGFGPVAGL